MTMSRSECACVCVRERERVRARARARVCACVCTVACERSKRLTKYPRLTVSCTVAAYLLYPACNTLTVPFCNSKNNLRTNFC